MLGNLEGEYSRLWVAPISFKYNVLRCIDEERQKTLTGKDGRIIIKCNSLTDKDIIEKLADTSCDGVRIYLIIRGICCLIPRMTDATENIRVISIVGRFLEHSRVFCFGTGSEQKIYISSADHMTRNTQRRMEIACPILDIDLNNRIAVMLDTLLADNTQAWEQFSDGRYVSRHQPGNDPTVNSQEIFSREACVNAPLTEENTRTIKFYEGRIPLVKRIPQTLKALFKIK